MNLHILFLSLLFSNLVLAQDTSDLTVSDIPLGTKITIDGEALNSEQKKCIQVKEWSMNGIDRASFLYQLDLVNGKPECFSGVDESFSDIFQRAIHVQGLVPAVTPLVCQVASTELLERKFYQPGKSIYKITLTSPCPVLYLRRSSFDPWGPESISISSLRHNLGRYFTVSDFDTTFGDAQNTTVNTGRELNKENSDNTGANRNTNSGSQQ